MFSNINPKLAEPQHISSRHGLHSVNFDDHKWPMASPCWGTKHMEVSWNRGTPKSSIFSRFFYSKPFILGYPHLWKPPYEQCSKPSVIPAYCILLLRILDPLSTWSVFCCKWTPRVLVDTPNLKKWFVLYPTWHTNHGRSLQLAI